MNKVDILLVDDHSLVRDGIKALLEEEVSLHVVGEASNGLEALGKVNELQPDLVIIDIRMPEMTGIEAVKKLTASGASSKCIMLSMHDSEEYILQSVQAGASGYLLKDASKEEFLKAVYTVSEGGKYFSGDVSSILVNNLMKGTSVQSSTSNVTTPVIRQAVPLEREESTTFDLTKRERQILELAVSGSSNKEIAEKLNISKRTIEVHRFNLMKKMDVKNILDLTNKARKYQLIP